MKRIIATLIIGMTLSAALPTMARHGNRTSTTISGMKNNNAAAKKDSATAIVAFSDTTDTDDADADSVINYNQMRAERMDPIEAIFNNSLVRLTALIIISFLTPVSIIGLIIYLIVKSRNQKLRLAEMAIKSGQPIPDFVAKNKTIRNDLMWSKGIKNISIGIGLTIMFFILGFNSLCGIGLLIAIYGVGQAVIAKTTYSMNEEYFLEQNDIYKNRGKQNSSSTNNSRYTPQNESSKSQPNNDNSHDPVNDTPQEYNGNAPQSGNDENIG